MDKNTLQQFKHLLKKEAQRIKKELSRFTTKGPRSGDYQSKFSDLGSGQDENAREVELYQSRLSMEGKLKDHLQKIKRALEKIRKKTYGKCELCQKSIPVERLRVSPEGRHCMACHQKKKV